MDILTAISHPQLFGPWFQDRESWKAWEAYLAALFGLPMSEEALAIYRECTGRQTAPETPFNEAGSCAGDAPASRECWR